MSKNYTITEPLVAVRTYEVQAGTRQEAVDLVMMGRAGVGTVRVDGPQRLLKESDAKMTYNPSNAKECLECDHPVRSTHQLVADFPGTRIALRGVCSLCRGAGVGQKIATHCKVCDRRLRAWGARASDDPTGVKRGDAQRCAGCKFSNKEVLEVNELDEAEVAWVMRNVPEDLHHYFGVTHD